MNVIRVSTTVQYFTENNYQLETILSVLFSYMISFLCNLWENINMETCMCCL